MKQVVREDNWILNAEKNLKIDYSKNEDLVEKLRLIYDNPIEEANKGLEGYIVDAEKRRR